MSYVRYTDTGISWIGTLPEHWSTAPIRRIGSVFAGATPSRSEPRYWTDGKIPWLSSGDVNLRRIYHAKQFITEEGFSASSTKWIRPRSLVVALAGQGKTKGTVATVECETTCNQSLAAIELNPGKVDHRFLAYYLESRYLDIRSLVGDGLRDGLNLEHIKSIPTPVPPLGEQVAISEFLDYVDRRVRRYIRAKQKLTTLLNEHKQIIVHRAVTRGLDPDVKLIPSKIEWLESVPEGWTVKPLVRCCIERADYRGKTPTKTDAGVFLVTAKNIRRGWIDYEASKEYVSADEYHAIMRRGLPKIGDLLFTTEAPLGNFALVDREDVALAQRVIRFRLRPADVVPEFALHAVLSPYFQNQLLSRGTGSTAIGIKASKLPQLLLLLPPVRDQRAILARIETETGPQNAEIVRVEHQITLLKEYRTRLIADVVTGKLDVREAAARLPVAAEDEGPFNEIEVQTGYEDAEDADLDAAEEVEA